MFYSTQELLDFGFSKVGNHHQISNLCRFYGVNGTIGDHVRIDDFCIFKGQIEIGSHVHVSAFCVISGASGKISLGDFTGLACRCTVYTGTDSYNADCLTNSTVPKKFKREVMGDVTLGTGSIIGAHSIIFPCTILEEFVSFGVNSVIYGRHTAGNSIIEDELRRVKNVKKLAAMAEEVLAGD